MPFKEKTIKKIYYSIGEVAAMFDVNKSLIRFWEKEFNIIKPKKNKKGNRYFTEKDINNFLKRVKKNKKYTLTVKDQIFLDSLRFDGIEIDKKYNDLFQSDISTIPTDIQVMINNNEKGAALLRIVEVIGQDELESIDDETISFIISTLNQLNIDIIRNKILLKVLPLKV